MTRNGKWKSGRGLVCFDMTFFGHNDWRIPLLLHSNCDLHLPVECTPRTRVWLYYRCGRWRSYSSNPEMRLSMTYCQENFTKQKQVQKLPQRLYKKQDVCHHMFYLLECLHLGVCMNEFCWFSKTAFISASCISICFSLIWQGFVCIKYTISLENMKSCTSSSWLFKDTLLYNFLSPPIILRGEPRTANLRCTGDNRAAISSPRTINAKKVDLL